MKKLAVLLVLLVSRNSRDVVHSHVLDEDDVSHVRMDHESH